MFSSGFGRTLETLFFMRITSNPEEIWRSACNGAKENNLMSATEQMKISHQGSPLTPSSRNNKTRPKYPLMLLLLFAVVVVFFNFSKGKQPDFGLPTYAQTTFFGNSAWLQHSKINLHMHKLQPNVTLAGEGRRGEWKAHPPLPHKQLALFNNCFWQIHFFHKVQA